MNCWTQGMYAIQYDAPIWSLNNIAANSKSTAWLNTDNTGISDETNAMADTIKVFFENNVLIHLLVRNTELYVCVVQITTVTGTTLGTSLEYNVYKISPS